MYTFVEIEACGEDPLCIGLIPDVLPVVPLPVLVEDLPIKGSSAEMLYRESINRKSCLRQEYPNSL